MAALYKIVFKRSVLKDIRSLPQSILQSIQQRILALSDNPIPSGAEPIAGYKNFYRIRIGTYRIVYEVSVTIRIITIVKIGHRKDVYRNLRERDFHH